MNEERAKAGFDIRAMTILMDGGEKNTIVIEIKNFTLMLPKTNNLYFSLKKKLCRN